MWFWEGWKGTDERPRYYEVISDAYGQVNDDCGCGRFVMFESLFILIYHS